jgi:hypothetical protein
MDDLARAQILEEAISIICGDRNVQYGEPDADFRRTANLLNALEFNVSGKPLESHHIAIIGIALKLSRMTWSPEKRDHWLDVAGYAACGWECAEHKTNSCEPEPDDHVWTQTAFINGKWWRHYYTKDGSFRRSEELPDYAPLYKDGKINVGMD